jgi:hypothetical protein
MLRSVWLRSFGGTISGCTPLPQGWSFGKGKNNRRSFGCADHDRAVIRFAQDDNLFEGTALVVSRESYNEQ